MIRCLVCLLLFANSLKGQCSLFDEKDIIQTVAAYRSMLIKENAKAIENFSVLVKNWGELNPDNEEYAEVVHGIIYLKYVERYSNEAILRLLKKKYKQNNLMEKITEQDIEIVLDSPELMDLILNGVLKPGYPFVINPHSNLYTEMCFYQFESGQKIGEIGAGEGTFSILLGMITREVHIFINELDKKFIDYINAKIQKNDQLLDQSKIETVKGSKTTTEFAEHEFDKIIIRNTFHHFSKKQKMLESIKRALKDNGKLCLYEPVINPSSLGNDCKDLLERQQVLKIIEENGFLLEEEKELDNKVLLLRFRKR